MWERARFGKGENRTGRAWFWGVEDAVDGTEEEDGDTDTQDNEVVDEDSQLVWEDTEVVLHSGW